MAMKPYSKPDWGEKIAAHIAQSNLIIHSLIQAGKLLIMLVFIFSELLYLLGFVELSRVVQLISFLQDFTTLLGHLSL